MGGSESPRSGALAEYFEFVKHMTDRDRSTLQQVCGAVMILVPAVLLIALSAGVLVAVTVAIREIQPGALSAILGTGGFGLVCGGGIAVKRWISRRRKANLLSGQTGSPEPGQQEVGQKPGAEGDENPDEDDDPTSGGSIGA